jgi:hypothetical protein
MINSEALKLQLMRDVLDLPDDKIQKVADFVKSQLGQNGKVSSVEAAPSGHDPILDLIGLVSHGSLAANIDEDLYGEAPRETLY